MGLKRGDKLPYFELKDQDNQLIKSTDLKNKPVVIYFYPKNFTPGCTKEACNFRDRYEDFTNEGAVVIGVSSDSTASHSKFARKYNLPFQFLADTDGELRKKFNVKSELFGLLPGRETFVFDKENKLIMRYNSIKSSKHTTKALQALKE